MLDARTGYGIRLPDGRKLNLLGSYGSARRAVIDLRIGLPN